MTLALWQSIAKRTRATGCARLTLRTVLEETLVILRDHWETFKVTYPRFAAPDYDTAVRKMLDCGDPEKMGYVKYRCLGCGDWRRIGFTCKSSFCLRCAQPKMSQWADFIGRRLFHGVTYRHFILTTPDFLRGWKNYPKGFVAHLQPGDVPAAAKGLAEYLAKYVVSPPISVRRLEEYDGHRA